MQQILTETLVAKVRARTDTETPSPDTDFITNEFILQALQDGYADLIDFVCSQVGDGNYHLFSLTTELGAGVTALPADFYRLVDVRRQENGRWVPLQATKSRRTAYRACSTEWPHYELRRDAENAHLRYYPEDAAPGPVQVTYIPHMFSLNLDGQSVVIFNGWDSYVIGYACVEVASREKTDPREHYSLYNRSRDRIGEAYTRQMLERTTKIALVESYPEDSFDQRWIY